MLGLDFRKGRHNGVGSEKLEEEPEARAEQAKEIRPQQEVDNRRVTDQADLVQGEVRCTRT